MCVPRASLQMAIGRLNDEIAVVDELRKRLYLNCYGWMLSILARKRVQSVVDKQNLEWRLANIPCFLCLSPGWGFSHSTLYVQWDPDRDGI